MTMLFVMRETGMRVFGGFMPVKIKVINSRPSHVSVTVHRPNWQEFITY